jgi:hypothetical protein
MNQGWRPRLTITLIIASLGVAATAITPGMRLSLGSDEPVHLVTDWSHRHLVFAPPKNLFQQFELSGNVRYVQQWVRRNAEKTGDPGGSANPWWERPERSTLHRDWNAYLGINGGGTAASVGAGNYPAKYSFRVTSASCSDFVVYNTGLTGSTTGLGAGTIATFSAGTPATGQSLTITSGANSILVTSGSVTNGTTWAVSNSPATNATNLVTSIMDNTNFAALNLTVAANIPATGQVYMEDNTAGILGNLVHITNNVALLSFPLTSFADGSTGVPTIVAYDNLYSSCSGTVPSTYWAYVTGTAGAVVTSPALSGDGTQLAFVQSTGGSAELVLVKWKADGSTVETPTNLTGADTVTNANYRACMAPCMTTITFGGTGTHADTNSSPFYDYTPGDDTLYVGDNDGSLQKFTGVFLGTPAIAGAPWPVTLTAGNIVTSPVYDSSAGNIYAADSGGFVYKVVASSGAVTKSARVGEGLGIVDGPIVDGTNGQIFVVTGTTGACTPGNSALIQFSVGFASGSTGTTTVNLGTCATATPLYGGSFDNAYYTGNAGFMYVCGNAGGDPTLYQVAVNAGNLGTVTTGPVLTTAATTCSPVTEIYNPNASGGAKDWLFLSVQNDAVTNGSINCPLNAGCLVSFNVASGATMSGTTATSAQAAAAGGASGIVVDNTVSTTTVGGASEIYFTPLSTTTISTCTTIGQTGLGGCAIQASQSGLN